MASSGSAAWWAACSGRVRSVRDAGSVPRAAWLGIAGLIGVAILVVAGAAGRSLPSGLETSPATATATPAGAAAGEAPGPGAPAARRGGAFAGVGLVLRSGYLLSIVSIVGLYELVSTVLDFQFTSAVTTFSSDPVARDQNFATVYATTNWLSMIVQLFLTSFVMRRFGLTTALLVLPCAMAIASTGFVLVPSLVFGALLSISDNGFSYSINQSSKEALYVPTSVEEKYQAKAVIDMFVQRFAKALGVGLSLVVTGVVEGIGGVRQLSFLVLPVLGCWAFAAVYAGRRFGELVEEGGPLDRGPADG